MFHKLITKYGLATHLALLASLPLVLMPFLSERALGVTILWLSAFSVLWLSLEPSIRSGEHLSTARDRVRSSLVRDPLFWFFSLWGCSLYSPFPINQSAGAKPPLPLSTQ